MTRRRFGLRLLPLAVGLAATAGLALGGPAQAVPAEPQCPTGPPGNDYIIGTPGNDQGAGSLCGGVGDDYILGRAGHDSIDGGAGRDTILGEGENDLIRGGAGTDYIYGGDGNDNIRGGADSDYMYGEAGNDSIDAVNGDNGAIDYVYCGPGSDTAIVAVEDYVDASSCEVIILGVV